ncbi:phytoene/squalene synthase family protein [Methanofollis aquaemaris]|uniref:Phytoene/squalene synthase family protein n=1 Tax=Methanofollis aquaemaris TaxID=126734 RepID=A0A8A3S5P6_9EURY|nr:phytoene/squalene synthase family protein [Methanofollis aquaemaris]QSZ66944.1 phytoene/squalene synthase family protein [Methanofollis aquaemaris]
MVTPTHYRIFRHGSTTYFYSTLFFPRPVREDVFLLYSFVRTADDFVDAMPQQTAEYFAFKERYLGALGGEPGGDLVVDAFVDLMERKGIEPAWVEAFLCSMESDLRTTTYATVADLEEYLYGSSEVVGLMMARVMGLSGEALEAARALGKAMQYINFIRDIAEDLALGRTYFPQDELAAFDLSSLEHAATAAAPDAFASFVRAQVERYSRWQSEGEAGFAFIPFRYLVPVKTASDLYRWTAEEIRKDPFVVYRRKVKPSPLRAVGRACANALVLTRPGRGETG